jgi:hypothetical protein
MKDLHRLLIKNGVLHQVIDEPFTCDPCIKAKATIGVIPSAFTRVTSAVGQLIHSDKWGPSQTPSIGNKRYYATFIDDFSRYVTVVSLIQKNEVAVHFESYVLHLKNQFGIKIKAVRSDIGGEY